MSPNVLVAIPVVLLALGAAPVSALDISIGGEAAAEGSAGTSDSGASAGVESGAQVAGDTGSDEAGGSTSIDAGASGSVSASVDMAIGDGERDPLHEVLLLIQASTWTPASFSAVTEVEATTYDIDAWITSENSAAFESTLAASADEIADLQAALAANAEVDAWLEAQGTDASAVVAVGVAADGSLAVFTHG